MPKDLFFSGKMTRDRQLLVLVQQLNDIRTAVSEMFVFPSWLKDGFFTPVILSIFMKEVRGGAGPYFCPFHPEIQSLFSSHLRISIYIYLPRIVHLVTSSCKRG